ncbi:MAG: hypothetical protein JNM79_10540 [Burkholderiales bacterium]|nr:hypothetical protein [Burkholderiales bacterium]
MATTGGRVMRLIDSLRLRSLGAQGDHPLESVRESQQVFAELRGGDAMKSLEEITDWFGSVTDAEGMKPERRFEVVRQLDELAQTHRIKLARDFGVTSGRQSRTQEAKLWAVNHDLWERAARAYEDLIKRVEAREKGSDALRKEVAFIAVRALRAASMRLKWIYVRYGPVPADLWAGMAHAYRFAEARQAERVRVTPYPTIPGESSPEEEYLHGLLLAASAPDALTPAGLDVVERLIAGSASKFRITAQPSPDSTYWVDLADPRPPLRLAAPPARMTAGLRFFATAAGHTDVLLLLDRVEKTRELPRGVDVGGTTDPEVVIEVLQHLRLNWAPQPPVRRTERRRIQAKVQVVHGFEAIVGVMRPSDLDFDLGGSPDGEIWFVENLSAGGFGASVMQSEGGWLAIGALIGVKAEAAGSHWEVAIVRRLSRDDRAPKGQVGVGVQILSGEALIGMFTTNIGRWANGIATVDGIVLPEGGEPGAVLVALPRGLYLPGEQLLAMIEDRRHLMFPIGIVDRGADYDLIKFRAMVQDG